MSDELTLAVLAVVFVAGLILLVSGANARGNLPVQQRKHRGLTRIPVGIVMMSVSAMLAAWWLLNVIGGALAVP